MAILANELVQESAIAHTLQSYITSLHLGCSTRCGGGNIHEAPFILKAILKIKAYLLKYTMHDPVVERFHLSRAQAVGNWQMLKALPELPRPQEVDIFLEEHENFVFDLIKDDVARAYEAKFLGEIPVKIPDILDYLSEKLSIPQNSLRYQSMSKWVSNYYQICIRASIAKTLNFGNCDAQVAVVLEYLLQEGAKDEFSAWKSNSIRGLQLISEENSSSTLETDGHVLISINGTLCYDPWQDRIFQASELYRNVPKGYTLAHGIEFCEEYNFQKGEHSFFELFQPKDCIKIMNAVKIACDQQLSSFHARAHTIVSDVKRYMQEDRSYRCMPKSLLPKGAVLLFSAGHFSLGKEQAQNNDAHKIADIVAQAKEAEAEPLYPAEREFSLDRTLFVDPLDPYPQIDWRPHISAPRVR